MKILISSVLILAIASSIYAETVQNIQKRGWFSSYKSPVTNVVVTSESNLGRSTENSKVPIFIDNEPILVQWKWKNVDPNSVWDIKLVKKGSYMNEDFMTMYREYRPDTNYDENGFQTVIPPGMLTGRYFLKFIEYKNKPARGKEVGDLKKVGAYKAKNAAFDIEIISIDSKGETFNRAYYKLQIAFDKLADKTARLFRGMGRVIKNSAKAVGRRTVKVAKGIGHGAAVVGKGVGRGTSAVGKGAWQYTKDVGISIGRAVVVIPTVIVMESWNFLKSVTGVKAISRALNKNKGSIEALEAKYMERDGHVPPEVAAKIERIRQQQAEMAARPATGLADAQKRPPSGQEGRQGNVPGRQPRNDPPVQAATQKARPRPGYEVPRPIPGQEPQVGKYSRIPARARADDPPAIPTF